MVDLSKILSKANRLPQRGAEPTPATAGEPRTIGEIITRAAPQQLNKIDNPESVALYQQACAAAEAIYASPARQGAGNFLPSLTELISTLATRLMQEDRTLLKRCLSDYAQNGYYLPHHAVNVCLLCLELGIGMGYDRAKLTELGTGAFLHDIGLVQFAELITKPVVFDEKEHAVIRQHSATGVSTLQSLSPEVPAAILSIVAQAHERKDGSGYPAGLKDSAITEYAQIVGIADVYEGFIHTRPYRPKINPLEAIKFILDNKKTFEPAIVKVLLHRIGIYPLGSVVRLNTKEIGVVTDNNYDSPLSPVVSVLSDTQQKELPQPKILNLAETRGVIYIEDCLNA